MRPARRAVGAALPWARAPPSYTHRRDAPARRQQVVDHPRAEHPRSQAGEDSDAQRDGEAAHRAGTELKEDKAGAERRDVRIADRIPGALVAGVDGRASALSQAELLADALE